MKKTIYTMMFVIGSVGGAQGVSDSEQALRDKVDACVQAKCPQDQSCFDKCVEEVQVQNQ